MDSNGLIHDMHSYTSVCSCQWLRWHPLAHVLLAGTSGGEGWMWKIPSGDCKTFQGHNSRNTCSAMLPNGESGNNSIYCSVYIWMVHVYGWYYYAWGNKLCKSIASAIGHSRFNYYNYIIIHVAIEIYPS